MLTEWVGSMQVHNNPCFRGKWTLKLRPYSKSLERLLRRGTARQNTRESVWWLYTQQCAFNEDTYLPVWVSKQTDNNSTDKDRHRCLELTWKRLLCSWHISHYLHLSLPSPHHWENFLHSYTQRVISQLFCYNQHWWQSVGAKQER